MTAITPAVYQFLITPKNKEQQDRADQIMREIAEKYAAHLLADGYDVVIGWKLLPS
jgi:hypothetical protein